MPLFPSRQSAQITPLPEGPFRFFALDVETANNQRGSICQLGIAGVRPDGLIETWVSFVDPQTDDWSCTRIHGITGDHVLGAPLMCDVLDVVEEALNGHVIYQHSGFDKAAIAASCREYQREAPEWEWRDSVQVARKAWPELKRNGGHGLASLKTHLGLNFRHHDAGEDARAAAEVVLRAEAVFAG
ncbi:exonuclease domain-containing protein [Primorskyibacter sp. 2E107]|uniref:exonuclease domain-containing protein n=1 Tax=Primorskyibacter sp. 2E107 TaxID=3403458 RepID=UPI003AF70351